MVASSKMLRLTPGAYCTRASRPKCPVPTTTLGCSCLALCPRRACERVCLSPAVPGVTASPWLPGSRSTMAHALVSQTSGAAWAHLNPTINPNLP